MRQYQSFLAVSIIIAVSCFTNVNANVSGMIVKLDVERFPTTVSSNHHFVMFYAPWCGHCQRLKSTWEELAESFHSLKDEKVVIADVDCTIDTSFCSQQDITGYPTLKLFAKGSHQNPVKFRGQRDLKTLISFVKNTLGLNKLDESIRVTSETEKVTGDPSALAIELTEENFYNHVASGDHFIKFYAPWCGHCQKLAVAWEQLAHSLAADSTVSIGKVDCTQHRSVCNDFDVKGYPTLLWIKEGKKIEKYQGSRTHEDLKMFVEQIIAKNTHIGSTGYNDSVKNTSINTSPVVHLVGSNFENGIATGLTFVKFYAPWCGHCKRLAPTWDELGTKFVSYSTVKIAKVDCTDGANRQLCADQKVNGFPTLFIYGNGQKLEEYNGNRSLGDLHSFVEKFIKSKSEKDEL